MHQFEVYNQQFYIFLKVGSKKLLDSVFEIVQGIPSFV